jgi:hypothetical protein
MKSSILGAIFAVAMLVLLLQFLSGAPDNASFIESINPVEAVEHLAVAFGFGAGLPTTLAVITAAGVLILMPVATFLVVRSIARRFDRRTRGIFTAKH